MIIETYIFKQDLTIPKGTIIEGFTPCGKIGIPCEIKIFAGSELIVQYYTIRALKLMHIAVLNTKIKGNRILGTPIESPYIDHILKMCNDENTDKSVKENKDQKFSVFRRNPDGSEGTYLTYVIAENEREAKKQLGFMVFLNCIIRL